LLLELAERLRHPDHRAARLAADPAALAADPAALDPDAPDQDEPEDENADDDREGQHVASERRSPRTLKFGCERRQSARASFRRTPRSVSAVTLCTRRGFTPSIHSLPHGGGQWKISPTQRSQPLRR
jgi:hypothetical protein